jgi:pteridine reductase
VQLINRKGIPRFSVEYPVLFMRKHAMQTKILTSKVALVTGSARRIGAEIARTLHAAGMNIVLHYNVSEEEALSLCASLNDDRPHSAVTVRANLQESGSEKALVQQAAKAWQRLDTLINNASKFYNTTLGKVTDFAWDDLMNSNLRAPFFLAQAAAPFLAASQGSIINITDIHAERPLVDYSVYCISKSGLLMMTK